MSAGSAWPSWRCTHLIDFPPASACVANVCRVDLPAVYAVGGRSSLVAGTTYALESIGFIFTCGAPGTSERVHVSQRQAKLIGSGWLIGTECPTGFLAIGIAVQAHEFIDHIALIRSNSVKTTGLTSQDPRMHEREIGPDSH